MFRPPRQTTNDELAYDDWASTFEDCDVVLVEGHSQTSGMKIEVWRAEVSDQPLACEDVSIVAVVTDDPVDVDVPVWSRRDVDYLAKRVVEMCRAQI